MKKIILFILVILLIPILLIKNNQEKFKIYGIKNNQKIKVKNVVKNEIIEIPIEEYVKGVVAGEMPILFNIEALKAQAVASRTYALKKIQLKKKDYDVTNDTNYQVYLNDEEIKTKYGDKYNEYTDILNKVIIDTKGEVILYNNDLIDAMFFSTSNGYTENSEDVFTSKIPYLSSVESKWDEKESPVFHSQNEYSKSDFLFNLGLNNNNIIINDIEKTNTGRVKTITINNKKFKSSEIRKIFNLKSTSFDIKLTDNTVIFNVNGFGHGVGLSQYGANGMAKEGYNYKEILNYYYKNCEIKRIN